jgi:hypothetical protein
MVIYYFIDMMYLIYCLCILFSSIKLNTIILSRRRRFGSQDQMITLSCAIECSFGMCSVSDRRCPENDLCFPTVAHCAVVRMAINDGRLGSVHKLDADGFQWLGGTQLGRWSGCLGDRFVRDGAAPPQPHGGKRLDFPLDLV